MLFLGKLIDVSRVWLRCYGTNSTVYGSNLPREFVRVFKISLLCFKTIISCDKDVLFVYVHTLMIFTFHFNFTRDIVKARNSKNSYLART